MTTDILTELLFDQVAAMLSAVHGRWRIEDHRVRGPGALAVRARYHEAPVAHVDLGLALDDDDEASVVWGCAITWRGEPATAIARAARQWVDGVALVALSAASAGHGPGSHRA
jgi:hypothetical protein